MRILIILTSLLISISLVGCSSTRGNVVPQTGPSMEQVYDSMGINNTNSRPANNPQQQLVNNPTNDTEADLTEIRHSVNTLNAQRKVGTTAEGNTFRKLPNPELKMYVFPHLAGTAEIPIPGYSTAFNAYSRDHYALPQETPRD